jgi:25S rRNA (cytosine2870-C5)-methyltransferase
MKRKLSTKETSQKKRKLSTKKAPVIEEEEVHTESLFGEDSEEEEQLEIEKEAERDDEEIDLIEQESKAELEDAKRQQEEIHIMSDKALDDTEDIKKIHARINENMRVLANFKELGEEGHSRADYMELLIKDVSIYYGYLPELIEKFLEFFSVPEVRKEKF